MRKFSHCLATVLALGAPAPALAQDGCEALLAFGIHDERDVLDTRSQYEVVRAFVCGAQFSSYESFRDSGSDLGIDVEGLGSIDFGGHDAQSDWAAWSDEFCDQRSYEHASDADLEERVRTVHDALADAFVRCKQIVRGAWVELVPHDSSLGVFGITAVHVPATADSPTNRAICFSVAPAGAVSCGRPLDSEWFASPSGVSSACTRHHAGAVVIAWSSLGGSGVLALPPMPSAIDASCRPTGPSQVVLPVTPPEALATPVVTVLADSPISKACEAEQTVLTGEIETTVLAASSNGATCDCTAQIVAQNANGDLIACGAGATVRGRDSSLAVIEPLTFKFECESAAGALTLGLRSERVMVEAPEPVPSGSSDLPINLPACDCRFGVAQTATGPFGPALTWTSAGTLRLDEVAVEGAAPAQEPAESLVPPEPTSCDIWAEDDSRVPDTTPPPHDTSAQQADRIDRDDDEVDSEHEAAVAPDAGNDDQKPEARDQGCRATSSSDSTASTFSLLVLALLTLRHRRGREDTASPTAHGQRQMRFDQDSTQRVGEPCRFIITTRAVLFLHAVLDVLRAGVGLCPRRATATEVREQ